MDSGVSRTRDTPLVNSFLRTLFAKSCSVADELGLEVRSRKSIRSRCTSSIVAMLLLTWARRLRGV